MHLRNGGRCDRRAELGEMILDLAAEGLGEARARLSDGEWRQFVLQVPQILSELGPDQIGACRQELPELDVAWAETRQGVGDPRLTPLLAPKRPGEQSHR